MARRLREPEFLKSIHLPDWVVFVLALIFIFRIPSFFEPYYYGDEMIYLALGNALEKGLVFYRDIHDNKPPLLYLMAGIAGSVFWFRAILALWMMGTTAFFYKLSDLLFPKNKRIVQVSVVVFAVLTTIPLLEGQIANAELFMIGPTIIAFWLLISRKNTPKILLLSGALLSVSTLFKVPALFDIGALGFFWLLLLIDKKIKRKKFLESVGYLSAGFLTPILLTMVYYAANGALGDYLVAAFLQNVGYLSSFRPEDESLGFLAKNGPLLFRGVLLLALLGVLGVFRKKLSREFIFASAWLFFGLFAVALSERPYPHYLIQTVPAISLLVGMLAARKNIEQSLAIVPLFFAMLVPTYYNFWYYPTLDYYVRFGNFVTGRIEPQEYLMSFDENISRNYNVSLYLRRHTREDSRVYVHGDSSTIYALSRRVPPIKYVAGYHINDFSSGEEVAQVLMENPPAYIIILPDSRESKPLRKVVRLNYMQVNNIEGAEIWKRINEAKN